MALSIYRAAHLHSLPLLPQVGVLTQPGGCKKALLAALLRLSEPHGTVRIDGIDISDVGLRDLREKLSVIQQVRVSSSAER